MACLSDITLKGIAYSCEANLAGISKVYLGYFDDFTITPDETTHSATIEAIEGGKLYEYTFAKKTGSLTSTLTKDETNGIRYYTNTINLQFNKMEGQKHLEIEAMAAESLIAIVVDNNKKSWIIGADGYVSADATTAQSGASYDELNGYTLSLSGMSAHLPYSIEESGYTSLVDRAAQIK